MGFDIRKEKRFWSRIGKVFCLLWTLLAEIVKANQAVIAENVLAVSVDFAAGEGYTKQWDVNGENVTFTVAKA
mgnify:CR=1 FL=1